ncbi:hypothetical protein [Massilia sp. Se16.2.3]|uniref:hypothetical protein n=1 Tax=Massilia sp. Se16.2.3 TaxID=2709303 RepID=UPI001602E611|nr:hypothetical protein [Massilia sp. Se16.2.3]QNB00066.1 hypothetical protein G4G31_16645 [Massilia sp. Se16.2.3]
MLAKLVPMRTCALPCSLASCCVKAVASGPRATRRPPASATNWPSERPPSMMLPARTPITSAAAMPPHCAQLERGADTVACLAAGWAAWLARAARASLERMHGGRPRRHQALGHRLIEHPGKGGEHVGAQGAVAFDGGGDGRVFA